MSISGIVRQCAGVAAGCVVAVGASTSVALAQSASEASLYQAGYNAGLRLQQEGFELTSLDGAPYYDGFLENREIRTISVSIPRPGEYILLVGGDDDTVDLDLYFPQINASDVSYGNTAFINFNVSRPGEFVYEVDMINCRTVNCGIHAVLLRVGS